MLRLEVVRGFKRRSSGCVCARARAFARSREKERKREIKKKEIRKIGRNLVGSGNFS